jgi:hypothetical protein
MEGITWPTEGPESWPLGTDSTNTAGIKASSSPDPSTSRNRLDPAAPLPVRPPPDDGSSSFRMRGPDFIVTDGDPLVRAHTDVHGDPESAHQLPE